jgi:hypothetical protein
VTAAPHRKPALTAFTRDGLFLNGFAGLLALTGASDGASARRATEAEDGAAMEHDHSRFDLDRRPTRPGLVLEAGSWRFPIVDLTGESVLIEARDSATLRGYADIYDGDRHVAQCLIVLAAPEGALLRCSFKRRTPFRLDPPADYALG